MTAEILRRHKTHTEKICEFHGAHMLPAVAQYADMLPETHCIRVELWGSCWLPGGSVAEHRFAFLVPHSAPNTITVVGPFNSIMDLACRKRQADMHPDAVVSYIESMGAWEA
jgi:hypothetical protein